MPETVTGSYPYPNTMSSTNYLTICVDDSENFYFILKLMEARSPIEPSSKSARRRRMEIHRFNFVPNDSAVAPPVEGGGIRKRMKFEAQKCKFEDAGEKVDSDQTSEVLDSESAKFGMTSVCGRRRDMEDAVAIHPSFSSSNPNCHFYGVYDGHGCSHVATRCREKMHEIVKKEFENEQLSSWNQIMRSSFSKMDKEAVTCCSAAGGGVATCRCELQTPQCDAVGSTAVVAVVTPDKIIVSNCGDSRAVLCRNGVAFPLSVDHKPDRPDELNRIEKAGGRVIFWDGARVLGVLAMSRAIGDGYLKPYVIPEPEVTVTERTEEDECLIIASDGLWDVVSNETACGVARMCLKSRKPSKATAMEAEESSDRGCLDATILLTKLALARRTTDNVSVVVVDLRRG